MAKINLDLSKFKHVKTGDKTTVLKHKDGHFLHIAHEKLGPDYQAQLKALGQSSKDAAQPTDKPEAKQDQQTMMASGGKVQSGSPTMNYADGGDVPEALSPQTQADVGSTMTGLPVTQPDPATEEATSDPDRPTSVTPQQWAKMDPRVKLMQTDPLLAEQMFPSKGVLGMAEDKLKEMGQKADADRQKRLEKLGLAQPPQAPGQTPAPATTEQKPPDQTQPQQPADAGLGFNQNDIARTYHESVKASEDLAAQQEKSRNEYAANQQKLTDQYTNHIEDLNTERKNFIQDIQNGYVDPEKYWTGDANGNGSHSRVMAGIGMILAGFNPTNSPNAAIDFVNKQIDRSVEAQKANLNAKHNLLSANLQQFKNVRDATDMTKIMQTDMVLNQLQIAAAKAAVPQAKMAAMEATTKLANQAMDLNMKVGMRRMMMGLASNPGAQSPAQIEQAINFANMANPELGKTMREAFVPHVGMSRTMQSVPQDVRKELISHQKLDDAAKDLLSFTKTHTTIVPRTADYNTGAQKALVLQQILREPLFGTVYRESEKPLMEKMVNDNPANFFKEFNTNPKLRELIDRNMRNYNIIKSNYNLPVTQQPSNQPQIVKHKSGAMMQKVPGGYIPYKGE